MKGYLEMRGADGGRWDRICALPALWVGLLYDQTALDAAWDLVKHWTPEDHDRLRREVPALALGAASPASAIFSTSRARSCKLPPFGLAAPSASAGTSRRSRS